MTHKTQSKKRHGKNEDAFPNAPNISKANYEHSETCNKVKLRNFIKSECNAKLQVFCLLNYIGKGNQNDLLKKTTTT